MWIKDRQRLIDFSDEMIEQIRRHILNDTDTKEEIKEDIEAVSVKYLKEYFDKKYGGFSKQPKFPTPHNILFLMEYYDKNKDKEVLNMIEKTLQCYV